MNFVVSPVLTERLSTLSSAWIIDDDDDIENKTKVIISNETI